MALDLAEAVLSTGIDDVPDLSAAMTSAPGQVEASATLGAEAEAPEIISPEAWAERWGHAHDMLGGMVQMRTGAACPLGDQARSEGGLIAAQAAYSLIEGSPARTWILGVGSSFWGQIVVLGFHGVACVQMVKAARAEAEARAEGARVEAPAA